MAAASKYTNPKFLSWVLVLIGALAQLKLLLNNQSLWLDEATLALNILKKDYLELLGVLDYELIVPLGYLLLQKFIAQIFDYSELGFRLISFLGGLGVLLYLRKTLFSEFSDRIAFIGVSIGVLSLSIFNFAVEARHYILEVLFTLVLFSLWKKDKMSLLYIVATVSTLFSLATIFVLGGILLIDILQKRPIRLLYGHLSWLVVFAIIYFQFYFNHPYQELLVDGHFEEGNLIPFGLNGILIVYQKFSRFFVEPMGFSLIGIGMVLFFLGTWISFKSKDKSIIGLITVFILFGSSVLGLYPIGMRFSIFLFPILLFPILKGIEYVLEKSKSMFYLVVVLLLLNPVLKYPSRIFNPEVKEDWRSAVQYYESKYKGNAIYLSYNSRAPFHFYESQLGFDFKEFEIKEGQKLNAFNTFKQDIKTLKASEFCVLIGHDFPIEDNFSTREKINWLSENFKIESQKDFQGGLTLISLVKK